MGLDDLFPISGQLKGQPPGFAAGHQLKGCVFNFPLIGTDIEIGSGVVRPDVQRTTRKVHDKLAISPIEG